MALSTLNNKYFISGPVSVMVARSPYGINEPEHKHDFIEFVYMLKGECLHIIDGKEYRVIEFTNQSTHVEPCPDCCFGSYTHIGKKQMKLKGVVKTVTEGSFVCKKPDGFFHCTAVSRKDGKNVYYKSSLSHTKKN